MEIDTQFLHYRNLESLYKLDESSVRIFNVCEVAVGLSHLEICTAVAHELVSHGF